MQPKERSTEPLHQSILCTCHSLAPFRKRSKNGERYFSISFFTSRLISSILASRKPRGGWSSSHYFDFRAEPGSAIFRCFSANIPAGVTLAIADWILFFQPETTSPSPLIMESNPVFATSADHPFPTARLWCPACRLFRKTPSRWLPA